VADDFWPSGRSTIDTTFCIAAEFDEPAASFAPAVAVAAVLTFWC
jgi:hypothetical protein